MNRREFIKHIACMAAGASALPEQLQAFEAYYLRNTPLMGEPFICFDEMTAIGLATGSAPVRIDILDGDNHVLTGGLNAFGGVYYWRAFQDQKIMMPLRQARWKMSHHFDYDDAWVNRYLNASVSYIDQDGIRVRKLIRTIEGSF